jgi:surface polysaccharide O-acyltransferase-like enzyme
MDDTLSRKLRVTTFIAIILVVFIHAYNLKTNFSTGTHAIRYDSKTAFIENLLSENIAQIAVPFFFIASGYLFHINIDGSAESFKRKISKRSKTLLVPFLFWSTSAFAAIYIAQLFPATGSFFSHERFADYSIPEILRAIFVSSMAYQLWFIRDLFIFVLLTPIIFPVLRRGGVYFVSALMIIWLTGITPEWPIFRFIGFVFFVLGSFIATSGKRYAFSLKKSRWLIIPWLIIVLITTYLMTYGGAKFVLLENIAILIGVTAFWFNYDWYSFIFERKRIFWVTQFTFFVYAAHEPMLVITRKLWIKLLGISEASALIGYFVCPLLVLFICITLAIMLKSYCRGLYNVMTGWR